MAVGTPFHSRTEALCTSLRWKQWSGYFVAVAYEDFHDPEYHAVRNGAGLIDVSPLYKYDIEGPDALRLVDRLITRDATKCHVGQVLYAAWCDEDGKVLQDGCFQRLEDNKFRATAAEQTLAWFLLNAEGMDVQIEDVSERYGALALQGPSSRQILQNVSSRDLGKLRFFRLAPTELAGIPVVVTRTGYTGDLGYEVWVDSARAEKLWDVLVESGQGLGIEPAGMVALDRTRIEAGFPLIDVDFWNAEKTLLASQRSSPYEINMGWAVNLSKPWFVGKAALVEEKKRGTERFLVGLEVSFAEIRASLRARRTRAPARERDLARRRSRLLRRPASGQSHEQLLVAVPEEVSCARHRRPWLRSARHRARFWSSPSSTCGAAPMRR